MTLTLYRYLLKELFPAFFLGLVGFTFLLLTGRILQLAELFVNKGVPLEYILKLLAFLLPSFLVLTIPMSTLLSVMLGFNRLSSDNEVTALKASGISLYQMLPPVLFFALFAFLGTALLALYSKPKASEASRALLYELAKTKANIGVRERAFNDDFEGLVLYVEQVKPKTLQWHNIFISDSRTPAEVYTIIAREGEVLSDPKALAVTLRLKAGSIHKLGTKPDSYQRIDFNAYDLRLYLKTGLREKKSEEKNPADMTLGELMQAIRILESRKKDVKAQWVKVHEKFSVPFACLTFAVIAVPLGVQSRGARKSKSRGLSWSIGVLLLYYLLTNAGNSLSERGVVPVEMGMWAPNFLFLSLGIYLLVKAARESPVLFLVWIQKAIERLRLARERKGGPEG